MNPSPSVDTTRLSSEVDEYMLVVLLIAFRTSNAR
jgi:hypothetical protein